MTMYLNKNNSNPTRKKQKIHERDSSWNQKRGVDEECDPVIDQSHSQYPWGANFEEDQDIIEILFVQKDINTPKIIKYQKEEKNELDSND